MNNKTNYIKLITNDPKHKILFIFENHFKKMNELDIKQNEFYETKDKIALRIWVAIQDCKGSFAQRLANEISKIESKERTDVSFSVPDYICRAIDVIIRE